jgi:hypothetical protein
LFVPGMNDLTKNLMKYSYRDNCVDLSAAALSFVCHPVTLPGSAASEDTPP